MKRNSGTPKRLSKALSRSTQSNYLEGMFRTVIEERFAAFKPAPSNSSNADEEFGVLDLSSCFLNAESLRELVIPRLSTLSGLTSLNLFRNYLGDDGVRILAASAGAFGKLIHLDLTDNDVGPVAACAIADMAPSLASLQYLYLSYNRLGREGAMTIVRSASSFRSLKRLDLDCNQIGDKGSIDIFKHADQLRGLSELNLGHNQIRESGAQAIAEASAELYLLNSLWLDFNEVGYEGFAAIASRATDFQQLRFLGLNGNLIGSLPKEIGDFPELSELELTGNYLDTLPAEIGKLAELKRLQLNCNAISSIPDEIGKLAKLEILDVSDNNMSALPSTIAYLTKLMSLTLSDNPDIDSIDLLEPLVDHGTLRQLIIRRCLGIHRHYKFDESVLESDDATQIFDAIRKSRTGNRVRKLMLKAMLLGEGEIGKSRLRYRLLGKDAPAGDPTTESFQISELPEEYRFADMKGVRLRLFDAGGQRSIQGAHRLWMSSQRNLFIIMCRGDQSPDAARLAYWLRMVARCRHGTKPPEVLIIVSWADQGRHEGWKEWSKGNPLLSELQMNPRWVWDYVDRPDGRDRRGNVVVGDFNPEKLEEVKGHLRDMVKSFEAVLRTEYAPGFLKLEQWLMAERPDDVPEELRDMPMFESSLTSHQFRMAFDAVQLRPADAEANAKADPELERLREQERERWLEVLSHLGTVCWLGSLTQASEEQNRSIRHRIFRPDWIKQPIYRLIRSEGDEPGYPRGMLSTPEIERRLEDFGLGDDGCQIVLAAMRTSQLMFGAFEGYETKAYLFPDRLPVRDRPIELQGWSKAVVVSLPFIGEAYLPRLIGLKWENIKHPNDDARRDSAIFTFGDVEVHIEVNVNAATTSFRSKGGTPEEQRYFVRSMVDEFRGLVRADGDDCRWPDLEWPTEALSAKSDQSVSATSDVDLMTALEKWNSHELFKAANKQNAKSVMAAELRRWVCIQMLRALAYSGDDDQPRQLKIFAEHGEETLHTEVRKALKASTHRGVQGSFGKDFAYKCARALHGLELIRKCPEKPTFYQLQPLGRELLRALGTSSSDPPTE